MPLSPFLKHPATLVLAGLAAAGLMLLAWNAFPMQRPALVNAYAPAKIAFTQGNPLDIGTVLMDTKTDYGIVLHNAGGEPLVIQAVEPSCGCTVAKPEESVIQPGKSTRLLVTLDSSLKLGAITKTIDIVTNDAEHPRSTLTLTAMAIAPKGATTHNGTVAVKDPLVLFKEDCASCHVQRGEGKLGEELFLADCGMCHGMDAQGGVAPSLLTLKYDTPEQRQWVRDVIANGAPQNPSMPPYSKVKGGPLTETQIDSLVSYLAYQAKQIKASAPSSGTPQQP
jgi:mono/diheme cytochrome c family protein